MVRNGIRIFNLHVVWMSVPSTLGHLVQHLSEFWSLSSSSVVFQGVEFSGTIGSGDEMDNHIVVVVTDVSLGPTGFSVDLLFNFWGAVGSVVHNTSVAQDDDTLLLNSGNVIEVLLGVQLLLHDSLGEDLVSLWGEFTWDDSDTSTNGVSGGFWNNINDIFRGELFLEVVHGRGFTSAWSSSQTDFVDFVLRSIGVGLTWDPQVLSSVFVLHF